MKLKLAIAFIIFPVSVFASVKINIHWANYCQGNFEKAKMLNVAGMGLKFDYLGKLIRPAKLKSGGKLPDNFCLEIKNNDEDGFGDYSFYNNDELILIAEGEGFEVGKYKIKYLAKRMIPKCTECEAGCWELKKTDEVELTEELQIKKKQRKLKLDIPVSKLLKLHLMGADVIVKVFRGNDKIFESSLKNQKWGWCE